MTEIVGDTGTADLVVGPPDTAIALGSGDVPVLGTPRLAALMEQAACAAIAAGLRPGDTTVGVHLDLHHLVASPIGSAVRAVATVESTHGRRIGFRIVAEQAGPDGPTVVGHATHERVVVDRDRFTST